MRYIWIVLSFIGVAAAILYLYLKNITLVSINQTLEEISETTTTLERVPKESKSQEIQTTTTQQQILQENEVLLLPSGFNKNSVRLSLGKSLLIWNKDEKTHNLSFIEIGVKYVLVPNEKLEFPTIERGKFTIKDEESGSFLVLEVF